MKCTNLDLSTLLFLLLYFFRLDNMDSYTNILYSTIITMVSKFHCVIMVIIDKLNKFIMSYNNLEFSKDPQQ